MLRPMILAVILSSALLALPSLGAEFNVKDYGAVADGRTDDTPAFTKAMDAAAKAPGSTVHAPAGDYLIAGTIVVPGNTTLRGDYQGIGNEAGTNLLATGGKGKSDGPGCVVLTAACTVRNIAIRYPEQTSEAKEPIPYPYAITGGPGCRIEDVFMLNPYQGINLDGAHANLVRNIWGEPLSVGINVDHCYDISRIENVHFWPYFSLSKPLRGWVQAHGIAMQFGRSDWQYCTNTFSYGYHVGYRFYTSKEIKEKGYPAGQTNGNFVGIGADCAGIAIDVEDSFCIGVSITNGEFAPFGGTGTRGVLLHKGNTGNLTLTNCNFWAVTDAVAEVQDGSLNMTACNIHEWAVTKKDSPCFIASSGRLNVNACTFNKSGLLAEIIGEKTRASFTNNMGIDDPMKITNHIGKRAVFSGNNPAIEVAGR